MKRYHRRIYRVAAEREETVSAALWSAGALGLEIRDGDGDAGSSAGGTLLFDAWFAGEPGPLSDLDAVLVSRETVEDRDWLADYRSQARPFEIGRRFRVDPGDDDRYLLRLPARTAFGTGSHESTRLLVAWLEDLELAGRDVLDVGTGSGILAFAALVLGARSALGLDVDAGAALVARHNARLNRLAPRLLAGGIACLRAGTRFDVALVNVLPERIASDRPAIAALLAPGGGLLSSGNLWDRRRELRRAWSDLGLEFAEERRDGEWAAFSFRKP